MNSEINKNNENQNSTFYFSYSASENKEVMAIRQKYLPREESKLDELKRLDGYVQSAGMLSSLTVGILGALIFGIAICIALGVLDLSAILAGFCGTVGTVLIILAYPVYRHLKANAKEKYAPRIIELADELAGKKNQL